jgi:hypothetical protein
MLEGHVGASGNDSLGPGVHETRTSAAAPRWTRRALDGYPRPGIAFPASKGEIRGILRLSPASHISHSPVGMTVADP